MLVQKIKITFYISCIVNTVIDIYLLTMHLWIYKATLLLAGAAMAAVLSLLITGLGAWSVWKNKTAARWFMFIITTLSAFLHFVVTIVSNTSDINRDWENQKRGTESMHYMEQALSCCGKNGPDDYRAENMTFPRSCYPSGFEGFKNKMYKVGCAERWKEMHAHPAEVLIKFLAQTAQAFFLGLLSSRCINHENLTNSSSQNFQEAIDEAQA